MERVLGERNLPKIYSTACSTGLAADACSDKFYLTDINFALQPERVFVRLKSLECLVSDIISCK